ncbi:GLUTAREDOXIN [Salix viminalis]|uniref:GLUTAREDOXIN n=1 Tax=Salix viminalis TaxID=40686 RepID=A0A9Q0SEX3_SALVM|nr:GLUTAREDOXIN [Salix viminalis]
MAIINRPSKDDRLLKAKPVISHNKPRKFQFAKFYIFFEDMDMVKRLVADRPVVIFSRSTCCMSHSIKTLISSFGANPTVFELDQIPNGKQIEKGIAAAARMSAECPSCFHRPRVCWW